MSNVWSATTKLPRVTSVRLSRPLIGDSTLVQWRFSSAVFRFALAKFSAARVWSCCAGYLIELLLGDGAGLLSRQRI